VPALEVHGDVGGEEEHGENEGGAEEAVEPVRRVGLSSCGAAPASASVRPAATHLRATAATDSAVKVAPVSFPTVRCALSNSTLSAAASGCLGRRFSMAAQVAAVASPPQCVASEAVPLHGRARAPRWTCGTIVAVTGNHSAGIGLILAAEWCSCSCPPCARQNANDKRKGSFGGNVTKLQDQGGRISLSRKPNTT
jgi:hypothetical protein